MVRGIARMYIAHYKRRHQISSIGKQYLIAEGVLYQFRIGEQKKNMEPENATIEIMFSNDPWVFYSYNAIGVLGFLTNFLVLYVMWKTPRLYNETLNLMITNQAILDMLAAIALIIYAHTVKDSTILGDDLKYQVYCRLWMSCAVIWGLLYASTNNLIVITIERYLNVVHTMWHVAFFSRTRAKAIMVVGWLIGFAMAWAQGITTSQIETNNCDEYSNWPHNINFSNGNCTECRIYHYWPSDAARVTNAICLLVLTFIVPLVTFVFCYGRMLCVVHQRVRLGFRFKGSVASLENHTDRTWYSARRNIIHTLCIISFVFLSCWSWNQIYFFMLTISEEYKYNSFYFHMSILTAFTTCTLNPFVYVLKYKQFRASLKELFCKVPSSFPTRDEFYSSLRRGGSIHYSESSLRRKGNHGTTSEHGKVRKDSSSDNLILEYSEGELSTADRCLVNMSQPEIFVPNRLYLDPDHDIKFRSASEQHLALPKNIRASEPGARNIPLGWETFSVKGNGRKLSLSDSDIFSNAKANGNTCPDVSKSFCCIVTNNQPFGGDSDLKDAVKDGKQNSFYYNMPSEHRPSSRFSVLDCFADQGAMLFANGVRHESAFLDTHSQGDFQGQPTHHERFSSERHNPYQYGSTCKSLDDNLISSLTHSASHAERSGIQQSLPPSDEHLEVNLATAVCLEEVWGRQGLGRGHEQFSLIRKGKMKIRRTSVND